MFDDFHFEDYWEGINQVFSETLISIFPNPADVQLFVSRPFNTTNETVEIFDSRGRAIFKKQNFKEEYMDTRLLNNGIYLLRYSNNASYCRKKFLVQH
jgi:hypothetical protein